MDGSVFQAILLAFLFMAYLILVFVIVGDLMRDHKLSGWWKAVWIIALILIPWLTGLIYIIVRGKGMAERSAAQAAEIQKAQADYIKQVSGNADPATQIANAKKLHDEGVINDQEFEELKAKALAS
ncbi:MAG: SHOCT domain-containing protein [Actinobacteria bacterium]|nr:SHOCT domain-containing protein [Actinomycetota bacterium]MCB8998402.1 SHOCT domain-containing protein [Actinomycetota bacterium]MCB9425199.1 SHOCT domain-containing protein [Actinomycetota bacterium]HRY10377.1 SHOCT domain-containing protein [Candidatus Nanopelagicales bacterium]